MKDFNIDRGIFFPNQLIDGDPTECVGLTVTDMASDLDGVIYDPDFTYAMAFRLLGSEPNTLGVDAWAGIQSAVAYGLLPMAADTMPVLMLGELYVANWQNYPADQLALALKSARNGVKSLPLDFDTIIQHVADTKQGVGLPMVWWASFMLPNADGRLPSPSGGSSGHMVAVKGRVTIEGEQRMLIKPWLGKEYGAGGFVSLSRAQFYQCVKAAYAFDNNASRWISLIGIAITKYPFLADYVSSLINAPMTQPDPEKPTNNAPTAPQAQQLVRDMLKEFCVAIRDYEGKPGDRNYRNCNPGNTRYSPVGYLPVYGVVKKDGDGFAIFKDYDTGFLYLEDLIRARIRQHPNWSILDLMSNYAPSKDNNNPTAYAQNLATRLEVDVTYQIKNLIA